MDKLKKIDWLRTLFYFWSALKDQWSMNIVAYSRSLTWYFRDILQYRKLATNPNAEIGFNLLYPFVSDKTKTTPLEPTYFYQDTWVAKKILTVQPKKHIDVGSSVKSMGIISQKVPVTLVDIRPIELQLKGLTFIEGSILTLPFKDNSVDSLSSMCVIEHIGLGRYGDSLDTFGTEKAAKELQRVVKKNGNLYVSVPIDDKNRVYFNAHRSFTPEYILSLFPEMEVVEEQYIYGKELVDSYHPDRGFGTGLYHLRKKK